MSTSRQAEEGESLEVQRRQVEGYCLMRGLALSEVVVEEGVSGATAITERPVGGELFAKLKGGDAVVASKLDRLFRSALDALTVVEDLRRRGVSLHLLDLGGDISGNGLSKLFLRIAAAFAEAERDRIAERIRDVKRDQRARGRFLGGSVPFGWRREPDGAGAGGKAVYRLVPVPKEQAAIAKMRELRDEGLSLRAIRDKLAAEGVRVSHVAVSNALHREQSSWQGSELRTPGCRSRARSL